MDPPKVSRQRAQRSIDSAGQEELPKRLSVNPFCRLVFRNWSQFVRLLIAMTSPRCIQFPASSAHSQLLHQSAPSVGGAEVERDSSHPGAPLPPQEPSSARMTGHGELHAFIARLHRPVTSPSASPQLQTRFRRLEYYAIAAHGPCFLEASRNF